MAERKALLSTIFCLTAFLAGCTATPVRKPDAPVFFPPAPAPPRIQFLTSLSGINDLSEQSTFERFVIGERPNVKVDKPYGVAMYQGRIYVCDTNSTVFVMDLENRTFEPLAGAVGPGALRQPINISITEDGTKYVADSLRGQVVAFDRDDQFIRAYGEPGEWRPVDAIAYEGRLYVADSGKRLIHVFDRESGAHLKSFGNSADPVDRIGIPTNLAFDPEGDLLISDAARFQILRFDRDGHFKAAIGRPGDNLGHFARPKGIAVDREGRIFAVDASFNNVQIFNRDGRLLLFFGDLGEKPGGLILPAKVAIDYDSLKYFEPWLQPGFTPEYLILVTSQFGDRRINVFAFGQQAGQTYPSDAELLKQIDERRQKESGQ